MERILKNIFDMEGKLKRADLKIEKILDVDFRLQLFEMLQEAGVEGTEANSIILNKYKETLKKVAINRLKEVCDCIQKENFSRLNELLANSPAGDGYGCDNTYIRFDDISDLDDIGSVYETLKNLVHEKEC
jgi:hypothetical protein